MVQVWLAAAVGFAADGPKQAQPPTGLWMGTLNILGLQKLRLVLDVSEPTPGKVVATVDSIDQGASGIPVEDFTAAEGKLKFEMKSLKASYVGELKPDAAFLMSEHAWRTGGAPSRTSSMFVPLGKTATVDELIKGIIVQSANDAAISVAENMRGSEGVFAEAMTQQARELGLTKSVFKNATGLYDPDHLMTVREIAQLARYIIKEFPEYYPLFAMREFNYRVHRFHNRNPLLGVYPGHKYRNTFA